jgi:hypothetical protein
MSVSKEYTKEVQKQFGYSATWLPTIQVAPGDVGRLRDYQYTHYSTLTDLGIRFEVQQGSAQAEYEYCSSGSVSITTKNLGKAPPIGVGIPKASAGISIKFSREKAVVLRLSHCSSTEIRDLNSVGKKIIAFYKSNKWDRNNVVVTEAVRAEAATILISNSSTAQIDLVARGKVGPNKLDLADLKAKLQVLKESDIATKLIASKGLTPLFRTSGIRRKVLGGLKLDRFGGAQTEQLGFGIVDYVDFETQD